jgi:hypothetical protein
MNKAADLTAALRSDFLVVLQPSLVERTRRTSIENLLLEGSLKPHASAAALLESYEAMRRGLNDRARSTNVKFLDCSRVFNKEPATTFSDIWHFSDFGHEILARTMANEIALILGQRLTGRQHQSLYALPR